MLVDILGGAHTESHDSNEHQQVLGSVRWLRATRMNNRMAERTMDNWRDRHLICLMKWRRQREGDDDAHQWENLITISTFQSVPDKTSHEMTRVVMFGRKPVCLYLGAPRRPFRQEHSSCCWSWGFSAKNETLSRPSSNEIKQQNVDSFLARLHSYNPILEMSSVYFCLWPNYLLAFQL